MSRGGGGSVGASKATERWQKSFRQPNIECEQSEMKILLKIINALCSSECNQHLNEKFHYLCWRRRGAGKSALKVPKLESFWKTFQRTFESCKVDEAFHGTLIT